MFYLGEMTHPTGEKIASILETTYQEVVDCITGLDEGAFMLSPEGKWTAGQHLDHLRRSVGPVAVALGLPKAVPRLLFGKSVGVSRDYDGVVVAYQETLVAGGKASKAYIPKPIGYSEREARGQMLMKAVRVLGHRIGRFSESELDQIRLPHPLLGKITLREMLYFTQYHAGHHLNAVKSATHS